MNRGADIWNSSVRSFPLVRICRTRSGSWNGSPFRNRSLINEKIAVLSPIPSVSVITARSVNPGDFRNWRSANRKSVIISEVELYGYGAAKVGCSDWGNWIQQIHAAVFHFCLRLLARISKLLSEISRTRGACAPQIIPRAMRPPDLVGLRAAPETGTPE